MKFFLYASDLKTVRVERGRGAHGPTSMRGRGADHQTLERGRGAGSRILQGGRGAGAQIFGRGIGPSVQAFQRGRGSDGQIVQRGRGVGGQTLERGRGAGVQTLDRGPVSIGNIDRGRGMGGRGTAGLPRGRGFGPRGSFNSSRVMVGAHRGGLMGRGALVKSETTSWEDNQWEESSSSFSTIRGKGRGRLPLITSSAEWPENKADPGIFQVGHTLHPATGTQGLRGPQWRETDNRQTMSFDNRDQHYSDHAESGRWDDSREENVEDLVVRFSNRGKRRLMDLPFESREKGRIQGAGSLSKAKSVENVEMEGYFGDVKRKRIQDTTWDDSYFGRSSDLGESGKISRPGGNLGGGWPDEDGQWRDNRPEVRIGFQDQDDWRQTKPREKRMPLSEWEEVDRPRTTPRDIGSTRVSEYGVSRDFQKPLWEEEEQWQPIVNVGEVTRSKQEEWSQPEKGARSSIMTYGTRRFQEVASGRRGQHGTEARPHESQFGKNLEHVESHETGWSMLDARDHPETDYWAADDFTDTRGVRASSIKAQTQGTGRYGREAVAMRLKNNESTQNIEDETGWGDYRDSRTRPSRSQTDTEAHHNNERFPGYDSGEFEQSNDFSRSTDRNVLGTIHAQKMYPTEELRESRGVRDIFAQEKYPTEKLRESRGVRDIFAQEKYPTEKWRDSRGVRDIFGQEKYPTEKLRESREARDIFAQEKEWEFREKPTEVEASRWEDYGGIQAFTAEAARPRDSYQQQYGGRLQSAETRKPNVFADFGNVKQRGILKNPMPQSNISEQFLDKGMSELDKFKAWQQKTKLNTSEGVGWSQKGQQVSSGERWGRVEMDTQEASRPLKAPYIRTADQYHDVGSRGNMNRITFNRGRSD